MSETIKVLCYRSKTLSNGEHPLMLCVCKDRKRKFQSLGISIKAELWDFKTNQPKTKCPNRERITILINDRINEIQKAALDKRIAGKGFTATTLIESTTNRTTYKTVGEYYLTYIQNLRKENRIRYAGMFEVSYSSFIKFNKHLDIPFSDIDVAWLKRYEQWMKSNNYAVNTVGTRLRHLRAVFNHAIENKQTTAYPFDSYKLSKLNQQTAKRAISKQDIQRVINHNGKSVMECLAIDLFAFSYFTAGINFIDMAMLERSNIVDGQLIYYRKKTKKQIIIPLQDKAVEIIKKYSNERSPYLFPVHSPFHKTEVQVANRLHKVLAKVNKHLKDIGEKLKLPLPLTTYIARHSYATILKRAGVSTAIISESLGHSSERVTQIYLDSFENRQLNDAMKNLL